jgi:solute carrier family 25 carnitine/acylcarnitine transporter 20/29
MASSDENDQEAVFRILLCGGIAGVVTWASVFPLDMVKTRLQAQPLDKGRGASLENQALLEQARSRPRTKNSLEIAKDAYRTEGFKAFYRGLGICSVRAFIVNAVQVS